MLQNYRTDEGFAKAITPAKLLAEELGIECNFPQEIQIRSRRKKRQFDYEIPDDPILDPEKNFRVHFFNQIFDTAIQSVSYHLTVTYLAFCMTLRN